MGNQPPALGPIGIGIGIPGQMAAIHSGFGPQMLSGLVLRLRADMGITIGTGVSAWADQSGNGFDFSQGTGANQPAYTPDGTTPAIFYDNVGVHWLQRGFTAALNTADVTFVVFQRTIDFAALRTVCINRTSGQYTWTQNSTNELITRTALITAATATITNRTMRALTITSGDVATSYKDKAVTQVQTGAVGASPGAGTHYIGVNSDASANMYGYIYEVLQYNRVLSLSELQALAGYGARYGIT